MADSVPDKNVEFLKQSSTNISSVLKQINFNDYKQLLFFLGIAVVISIVFYIYIRLGQESTVRQNVPKPQEQVTQPSSKESKTQVTSNQDQQRKNDVFLLNSALKSYFLTNEKTPQSLDELVPIDLPELPTDPTTDEDYNYTPSQDQKSWQVTATLSDDTSFEVSGP